MFLTGQEEIETAFEMLKVCDAIFCNHFRTSYVVILRIVTTYVAGNGIAGSQLRQR